MKFDLDLFETLNAEYAKRPIAAKPRKGKPADLLEQAARRIKSVDHACGLRGKRVLEVGCGRGHTSFVMGRDYQCDAVGIDVRTFPDWTELKHARYEQADISKAGIEKLGQFDRIISFSVWEHIPHPFAALQKAYELLVPGGDIYFTAMLYRGPKASHRYRQVFFPWPHLLFTPGVFKEFFRKHHGKDLGPSWVNKLVAAEYLHYFSTIGFQPVRVAYNVAPLDHPFYERFEEQLGCYPIFDLERDFINAHLRKPAEGLFKRAVRAMRLTA